MIKNAIRAAVRSWNRFFFQPISPAAISVFRLFFGTVVFMSLLGRFPFREIFYSENGIVHNATTAYYFPDIPFLFFRWVPSGDPQLKYYFLAVMLASLFLIFGFCTRISSILVFLGLISLSNRNFFVDNAGDDLMRINCFFLMFTHAGAAFSIDRHLRIRKGVESKDTLPLKSPWAQRLLQLQLAYVYIDTVYLKLPGTAWQNGTALYYAFSYLELRRFEFKYLFYYLWQIKLATYGVLLAETAMCTLVWFRKLRYWVLAAALALHMGINLTMQFPIFQYVMMTSLINFIFPEDIEGLVGKIRRKFRA